MHDGVNPVDPPPENPVEVPASVHHEMAPTVPLELPPYPREEVPEAKAAPAPPAPPPVLPVVDVNWLDWNVVRAAVDPGAVRERMRDTVERMEALLDREGGAG